MRFRLVTSSTPQAGRPRRLLMAAAVAAAALGAGAGPALAQQRGGIDYGYEPPPGPQFNAPMPYGRGAIPPVWEQERIAASVEARRFEGPRQLLRAAERAVRQNDWGRANELLERAETDTLNAGVGRALRDPQLGYGGTVPGGAVVARINEAREAVVRADPRSAMHHIGQALSRIDDAQMFDGRDQYGQDRMARDRMARDRMGGDRMGRDRMSGDRSEGDEFERGYRAGRESRGFSDDRRESSGNQRNSERY